MADYTIEEFCDRHDACRSGREWALANCESMQDAWDRLKPEWLLWVATRLGVLTNKELRRTAVYCARRAEHFMTDASSKAAIAVAERHINDEATDEELAAAYVAAEAVVRAADGKNPEAYAAAEAAEGVAEEIAWVAAWVTAWAAAEAVETDAAEASAWEALSVFLRENTKPNFTKGTA